MSTIIADIGATNTRLAKLNPGGLVAIEKYKNDDFEGLQALINHYLKNTDTQLTSLRLAYAGWPDEQGIYHFTRSKGWSFRLEEIKKEWPLEYMINDLAAAAYGVLSGRYDQKQVLREGKGLASAPIVVLGLGTGLGLAYGFQFEGGRCHVQETFGGHMPAKCITDEQWAIYQLAKENKHQPGPVSYEDFVSGRGLIKLCQTICEIRREKLDFTTTQSIIEASELPAVQETLRVFHEFLGLFIRNTVMTLHGFGGVFMHGGFLQALIEKRLFDFDTVNAFLTRPVVQTVDPVLNDFPIHYINDPFVTLKGLEFYQK